jgi:hypothetical protein
MRICLQIPTTLQTGGRTNFSLLMNEHSVSDVRQTKMHTAEPLLPDSSHPEVEIPTANLKDYKSPGSDQILTQLIEAGDATLVCEIAAINFIQNVIQYFPLKDNSTHRSTQQINY